MNVLYLPFFGMKGYLLNAYFLNRIIKKLRPDVTNVHYASGYGILALLSNIKPYILSVWGSDVYKTPYESKVKKLLINKSLLNAQIIASTSCAMAKQVNGLHASTKHNIAITPFGINTSTFKSHRRIFSNEIITIGIVKTLEHRYGIDLLLNAFAQVKAILKKNNSKKVIKLVVVGGGHLESELKKLALKLNIEADVDFVGRVDNSLVVDYINKMDIFVVPSRIESFGVAAVEALACERPCIVANTGGLPEVIIDGETGLVVEAESANAIALSIVYLINNPDKAIEMGISGRLDVIHKYDEFHTVQKMIELYKTFISKNSH